MYVCVQDKLSVEKFQQNFILHITIQILSNQTYHKCFANDYLLSVGKSTVN